MEFLNPEINLDDLAVVSQESGSKNDNARQYFAIVGDQFHGGGHTTVLPDDLMLIQTNDHSLIQPNDHLPLQPNDRLVVQPDDQPRCDDQLVALPTDQIRSRPDDPPQFRQVDQQRRFFATQDASQICQFADSPSSSNRPPPTEASKKELKAAVRRLISQNERILTSTSLSTKQPAALQAEQRATLPTEPLTVPTKQPTAIEATPPTTLSAMLFQSNSSSTVDGAGLPILNNVALPATNDAAPSSSGGSRATYPSNSFHSFATSLDLGTGVATMITVAAAPTASVVSTATKVTTAGAAIGVKRRASGLAKDEPPPRLSKIVTRTGRVVKPSAKASTRESGGVDADPFPFDSDSELATGDSELHVGPYYSTLKARCNACPHPDCINSYVSVKSLLRHLRLHPNHNVQNIDVGDGAVDVIGGGTAVAAAEGAVATAERAKKSVSVRRNSISLERLLSSESLVRKGNLRLSTSNDIPSETAAATAVVGASASVAASSAKDSAVAVDSVSVIEGAGKAGRENEDEDDGADVSEVARRQKLSKARASNLRKNLVRHAVSKCSDEEFLDAVLEDVFRILTPFDFLLLRSNYADEWNENFKDESTDETTSKGDKSKSKLKAGWSTRESSSSSSAEAFLSHFETLHERVAVACGAMLTKADLHQSERLSSSGYDAFAPSADPGNASVGGASDAGRDGDGALFLGETRRTDGSDPSQRRSSFAFKNSKIPVSLGLVFDVSDGGGRGGDESEDGGDGREGKREIVFSIAHDKLPPFKLREKIESRARELAAVAAKKNAALATERADVASRTSGCSVTSISDSMTTDARAPNSIRTNYVSMPPDVSTLNGLSTTTGPPPTHESLTTDASPATVLVNETSSASTTVSNESFYNPYSKALDDSFLNETRDDAPMRETAEDPVDELFHQTADDTFHQLLRKNVSILDQLIRATSAASSDVSADPSCAAGFVDPLGSPHQNGDPFRHPNPHPRAVQQLRSLDAGASQILQPNASGTLFLNSSADALNDSSASNPLEGNQVRVSLNDANFAVIQTPTGQTLQVQFDPGQPVTTDTIQLLLDQIAVDLH